MASLLAVDAGQGGTRAVAIDSRGSVTAVGRGPGVMHLTAPRGPLCAARAIATAMKSALAPGDVPVVAVIGLSGWTNEDGPRKELVARLAKLILLRRVILTSDAVTAFFAARPQSRGVVLAVGSGTVAIAADGSGAWAFADGLGYILGDEGSGFWIGQRGLASAMAAADGRGGSDALLDMAARRYGGLSAIPGIVYGGRVPVPHVAAFAQDVITAAKMGEPAAAAILGEASNALARSAIAAGARVFPNDVAITVALIGGVGGAGRVLLAPLQQALASRRPNTTLRLTHREPVDGAVCIARRVDLLEKWFPGHSMEANFG